ncbi:MAG: cytochrome-c peroxidase, partial [Ferruginibacter sp.]
MANTRFYKTYTIAVFMVAIVILSNLSFRSPDTFAKNNIYEDLYHDQLKAFEIAEQELITLIKDQDLKSQSGLATIKNKIADTRIKLKAIDIWVRYLEPTAYLKLNGPLPVEWENEVFEKFEKPYRREGAGLMLAELYLLEKVPIKDSLVALINSSLRSTAVYEADSITVNLKQYPHFYLCNRLFLLNLAAIYTTGFECPDKENIIPELEKMMSSVETIYSTFNKSFPGYQVNKEYLELYQHALMFIRKGSKDQLEFDHFTFINQYINPLYALNQQMIREYHVVSNNFNDYTLKDNSLSIFNKDLYEGQNVRGIYLPVEDEASLAEIKRVGKLLFYDPILSGNNKRSCASCHKSNEYFTDTSRQTSFQFDNQQTLPRNTPSLVNVIYNHLIMLDGKHISLLNQAKDVVTNSIEMGGVETDVVKKVMSCKDYEKAFKRFSKLTPNSPEVKIDHIVSAVILYYSDFSKYYSPFDEAMNQQKAINENSRKGFNVFMGKAKCGTCHFIPQFNGVKPPYISSEFEVLGVPI